MNRFAAMTALALILGTPAMAQTDQPQGQPEAEAMQQDQAAAEGYVAGLEVGDILASELIGKDVYAPRIEGAAEDAEAPAGDMTDEDLAEQPEPGQTAEDQMAREQAAEEQMADQRVGASPAMPAAELDNMDNIGQVSEVILDRDGQVKAIVVGVGGFLGMGEREVALDMSRLSFTEDQDDPSEVYLIAETSAEELEAAPEFSREGVEEDAMVQPDQDQAEAGEPAMGTGDDWRGGRDPWTAPGVEREGFQAVEATQISADELIGSNVYSVDDEDIGTVDDVVASEDGELQHIVIDVGGFLGLGAHSVAIGFDEITVMSQDGGDELRVYVDATQEQLESMPEYAGNE